ncbi:hypothetical protein KPH14_002643 [Odynerus spinipes]|uniref:Uncharacterized protein n=1 Tax=Odynerus spinipes TaxID=1348599 RepID=A0AAD9RGT1_9HYME|nr:hypothetical protein KPH14_002643 [Odynerus spinipes]
MFAAAEVLNYNPSVTFYWVRIIIDDGYFQEYAARFHPFLAPARQDMNLVNELVVVSGKRQLENYELIMKELLQHVDPKLEMVLEPWLDWNSERNQD